MAGTTSQTVSVLGELFQQGKRPNNFLRMMGGLQGAVRTTSAIEFPTNVLYQLRAPSQAVALEGANAPQAQTVTVSQATNVVQLIHETVSATYLGQSDNTMTGAVAIPMGPAQGEVINPRKPEFQIAARMETIQRDTNYSFLQGVFAHPANPTASALKTRGVLTAITTNINDQSGTGVSGTTPQAQYRGFVNATLKQVIISNGYNPDDTWTIFGDATEYANIQAAYAAQGTIYLTPEIDYAGIKIRRIITPYGNLNIVLEPDMPAQELMICDMGVIAPVGLFVPQKGILFMEELAKTGSSDNVQIYGQLGVDHGPEYCHGLLKLPAFSL